MHTYWALALANLADYVEGRDITPRVDFTDPTLRGAVRSELHAETGAVLEIVIDGLTEADVRAAMLAGMRTVCDAGAARGIQRISAGNYAGKLGKFQFPLRGILA